MERTIFKASLNSTKNLVAKMNHNPAAFICTENEMQGLRVGRPISTAPAVFTINDGTGFIFSVSRLIGDGLGGSFAVPQTMGDGSGGTILLG